MKSLTASDKRRFLHMAFHPHGALVCGALGLIPPSEEGVRAEDTGAVELLQKFMATDEYDKVVLLASWYHDGVAALAHPSAARTDVEHMMAFFAAAQTFVVDHRESDDGKDDS